jgi:hypothetical protein
LDVFLAKDLQLKTTRIEFENLKHGYNHFFFQITELFPDLYRSTKDNFSKLLSDFFNNLRVKFEFW